MIYRTLRYRNVSETTPWKLIKTVAGMTIVTRNRFEKTAGFRLNRSSMSNSNPAFLFGELRKSVVFAAVINYLYMYLDQEDNVKVAQRVLIAGFLFRIGNGRS